MSGVPGVMAGDSAFARVVPVDTARPYKAFIGIQLLERLAEVMAQEHIAPSRMLVVTNPTVQALWLPELEKGLSGVRWDLAVIPDGEVHKNLETVSSLYDRLAELEFDRGSLVLALGGGVVGDLAGFAAATYMRGITFVQVPTTLLAQVDASVGGKVAVDHPRGKNLIGAFHQPALVLCDLDTLETLPARIYAEGLAEVVKTALIGGHEMFRRVADHVDLLLRRERRTVGSIVEECIRVKAAIVVADERDLGSRMRLNLGHTFGHAIETACGFEGISHGEAVAAGLVMATKLAVHLGVARDDLLQQVEHLLSALRLPTSLAALRVHVAAQEVRRNLGSDKKRRDGHLRFLVPREPGDITLVESVPGELIDQVISESARGSAT